MSTRRNVVFGGGVALVALSATNVAFAAISASPTPMPDEKDLEAGDLLWPKLPGSFVPYDSRDKADPASDLQNWTTQKSLALGPAEQDESPEGTQLSAALRNLSYAEFRRRYLQGISDTADQSLSLWNVAAVGHVAIVDIGSDGSAHVVEAINPQGVVRSSYADWVASRPNEIAWQGRLQGRSASDRKALVAAASTQLGKPYNFWDFDLSDDRDFYCSKLVWLAHTRALGSPIDGNPNPKRSFWFSPKQALYLPAIEIILDQGNYAFD